LALAEVVKGIAWFLARVKLRQRKFNYEKYAGILLLPVAVFLPLWLLFVGFWLKRNPTKKEKKPGYIAD